MPRRALKAASCFPVTTTGGLDSRQSARNADPNVPTLARGAEPQWLRLTCSAAEHYRSRWARWGEGAESGVGDRCFVLQLSQGYCPS